ncbi:hypothetical protein D9Q98_002431 [Chlorella vulgaris]|uniref:Uncharacterized protein n=1 Tax=Chlorella vulgaris TaxID=3077 RepID=A0A9D4Z0X7_CHLVU|nr:hypothetical protein D9Q98_002431 [Chlorella vulgaris]
MSPASTCSPERSEGPHCDHDVPTVLRNLNGRKVYVCSHYPSHHCSKWCPADVALVPLRRLPPLITGPCTAEQPEQPVCTPVCGDQQLSSPPLDASELDPEAGKTPSQQLSTPAIPAAPSKSSSMESRQQPSVAQRSLVPIFNAFNPAAVRAAQLGGRFVQLRPGARAVASMQQRASVSPSASGPGSAKPAARKRARMPAAPAPRQHAARKARHPLQELALSEGGAPFVAAAATSPATTALLALPQAGWPQQRVPAAPMPPAPLSLSQPAASASWLRSATNAPQ